MAAPVAAPAMKVAVKVTARSISCAAGCVGTGPILVGAAVVTVLGVGILIYLNNRDKNHKSKQ